MLVQDLRRHASGWFQRHQSAFADISPIKSVPTDTEKQKLARQQSQAELAGVYGIWEVITPCIHEGFVNAILTGQFPLALLTQEAAKAHPNSCHAHETQTMSCYTVHPTAGLPVLAMEQA